MRKTAKKSRRHRPQLAPRLMHLRRRVSLLPAARAVGDMLAVLVSFAVCYSVYRWAVISGLLDRGYPTQSAYLLAAVVFSIIIVTIFAAKGLYRSESSVLNLAEQQRVINGALVAAAVFFTLLFILKIQTFSRLIMVGSVSGALVLLVVERRIAAGVLGRLNRAGKMGRAAFIYGSGHTGRLLMKKIVQSPHLGLRVMGFIDDAQPVGTVISCRVSQADRRLAAARVLGSFAELPELLSRYGPDELLIALPAASPDRIAQTLRMAEDAGVIPGVAPQLGGVRVDRLRVEEIGALPLLRPLANPRDRLLRAAVKRSVDLIGALTLLLLTAPITLIAAAAIWADAGRPVVFRQVRAGRQGKPFRIYKFRTMSRRAPRDASSPTSASDERITRVGRILRRTSIDELPQLVNVLKGEMSLVGPRPEMLFLVEQYTPLERHRLALKPGITGIWQLSADRDEEIHANLEYDFYYIQNQSFVLDLLILMETAVVSAGVGFRILSGRSRRTVYAEDKMDELSISHLSRLRSARQQSLRVPLDVVRGASDVEA